MLETMQTVKVRKERTLPDEAILPNSERYVPTEDRIVIRGQLCQWSKVAPQDYARYIEYQHGLEALQREFEDRARVIKQQMTNMVEFTRRKYPGSAD